MHLHFRKRAFATQSGWYFLFMFTFSLIVSGCGQTGPSEQPRGSSGESPGVPAQLFATSASEDLTPENQDNSAMESGDAEAPLEGVMPAYSVSTQMGEYDKCENMSDGITEVKRTISESNTTTITLCVIGLALTSNPTLTVRSPDGNEYVYSYQYLRGQINFGTFPAHTFMVNYHIPAGVSGTHILIASDDQNGEYTLEIQT